MKKLAIDYEFSSRAWWENGGQDLWDAVTEGFDGGGVVVDDDLAASWMLQAEAIEGWHDGSEYAPHPVRVEELDEDDVDL
ncbi:MAG: hypothetical protein ACQGVC_21470 [Myxococcota bacterium]